jgi:hypothetical protein
MNTFTNTTNYSLINIENLVQWQLYDADVDAVMPWFTHPFLQVLKSWDLSDKNILEFGSGRSTRWLRARAKWVDSVETDPAWIEKIKDECEEFDNGRIMWCPDPKDPNVYLLKPFFRYGNPAKGVRGFPVHYDIIIDDGIHRNEVLEFAIKYFEAIKGGIIICDNWQQYGVWMSPAAAEMVKPYKGFIYEQEDHTDNDGVNKWKTAFWIIPPKIPIQFVVNNIDPYDGKKIDRWVNDETSLLPKLKSDDSDNS